jgi:hypothetical protein
VKHRRFSWASFSQEALAPHAKSLAAFLSAAKRQRRPPFQNSQIPSGPQRPAKTLDIIGLYTMLSKSIVCLSNPPCFANARLQVTPILPAKLHYIASLSTKHPSFRTAATRLPSRSGLKPDPFWRYRSRVWLQTGRTCDPFRNRPTFTPQSPALSIPKSLNLQIVTSPESSPECNKHPIQYEEVQTLPTAPLTTLLFN